MQLPAGHQVLRFLGGVCGTIGFLAWIALAWKAVAGLEDITPQSEEGGRLMVWALAGTLLMILGTVLLHAAGRVAEGDERTPSS